MANRDAHEAPPAFWIVHRNGTLQLRLSNQLQGSRRDLAGPGIVDVHKNANRIFHLCGLPRCIYDALHILADDPWPVDSHLPPPQVTWVSGPSGGRTNPCRVGGGAA